ncbi:MAG: TonB family protein [Candidatus Acidiferrales bacterium]|jgi:protein TonB
MHSSKIGLILLMTLFASTAAFAQGEEKEPAPPQNATTSDGSQPDASAPSSAIHAGAYVASAMLVHQVTPAYPPSAKSAHISGTVVLHALIAQDGTIEQLQYVSGPPLLLKSAMDAVQQWIYQPMLVNGKPVKVDTTISVVYTLGGRNPSSADESASPSAVPPTAGLPPASTADSSQDAQKEAAAPQTSTNASSVPNSPTTKPKSIRVGGNVAAANLIHRVTPVYPNDAKKKHIQGTVLLHAVIAQDGTMKTVEYMSGPTELTDSAINAVKQWRYKPTSLRGELIEVDTTISVVFSLGKQ